MKKYSTVDNLPIVELLIVKGANVNDVDNDGNSPLHIAAQSIDDNWEIINFLILNGAIVNYNNNDDNSPLHIACQSENDNWQRVNSLLLNGAKVNSKNNQGDIPLHIACRNCRNYHSNILQDPTFETIKLLLERNSNPKEKNIRGETSFKIAYKRRLDTWEIKQFEFMYNYRKKMAEVDQEYFELNSPSNNNDYNGISWEELGRDEMRGLDEDFPGWGWNID